MTRTVSSYVVRKLADCIEQLPKLINTPRKMPFVQSIVRGALEELKSDRDVAAAGCELQSQGDEHKSHLAGGKYSLDLRDAEQYRKRAEYYRKPVTSVWLSDTDKEALKAGFDDDETGIFEFFERQAADIADWLRENRHPRDAELFRSRFSFVCGEALLLLGQGVEVSQGLYKLNLDLWLAEAAKPLCDDLRQFANEMDSVKGISLRNAAEQIRPRDSDGQAELIKTWRNSRCPKLPAPLGKCPLHSQVNLYEPAAILHFLQQVEGPQVDQDFGLSTHFRKVSRFPRPAE